ncbi:sulfatase [Streptomyces sp. NPDC088354]|uniref:sulfatase n=1 Tax=Streptomyces sp. NPDC088354 TaxID=3365856 RepID=UPI00382FDDC5
MSLFTRSQQPPGTDKDVPPDETGVPEDAAAQQGPAEPADTATESTEATEAADAPEPAEPGDPDPDTAAQAAEPEAAGGNPAEAVGAPARDETPRGWRGRYPGAARGVATATTVLAAVLVLGAVLLPDTLDRLTVAQFTRIPAEALLGVGLALLLPPRPRRIAAVVLGIVLGLLTLLKFLDMGFWSVLYRPFDPVLDWTLISDGEEYLKETSGQAFAVAAVIGAILLVVALLVLMTLALVRMSDVVARHSAVATRGTLVLGTLWVALAAFGVRIAGDPLAAKTTVEQATNHVHMAQVSLADSKEFAKEAAVDPFAHVPPDQLLSGLRGKDVIFAFVESYGRSAVESPEMAPQVDAMLADGTRRLKAAGFSSRSAFLTSPTFGGGSWLAHSTFLSGLWIDNQQRYRTVTSSDRLTLTGAFQRADAWRTVGIMPGVIRSWPEGKFYGLDHVYDSQHLGYKGPNFSWSPVPDQYSLEAFQRMEHGQKHDKPLMSEIILVSSHRPWAPIPRTVGWDELGDGSVFNAINKEGKNPDDVWKSAHSVRQEYAKSIEYTVSNLVSWVERYGNDNTVLVFLGDHQPTTMVSGKNPSHDVPIAIVAHDKDVLDRMSGWGWQDGLRPHPDAPVWRMDTFRNRFLTTYGAKTAP